MGIITIEVGTSKVLEPIMKEVVRPIPIRLPWVGHLTLYAETAHRATNTYHEYKRCNGSLLNPVLWMHGASSVCMRGCAVLNSVDSISKATGIKVGYAGVAAATLKTMSDTFNRTGTWHTPFF